MQCQERSCNMYVCVCVRVKRQWYGSILRLHIARLCGVLPLVQDLLPCRSLVSFSFCFSFLAGSRVGLAVTGTLQATPPSPWKCVSPLFHLKETSLPSIKRAAPSPSHWAAPTSKENHARNNSGDYYNATSKKNNVRRAISPLCSCVMTYLCWELPQLLYEWTHLNRNSCKRDKPKIRQTSHSSSLIVAQGINERWDKSLVKYRKSSRHQAHLRFLIFDQFRQAFQAFHTFQLSLEYSEYMQIVMGKKEKALDMLRLTLFKQVRSDLSSSLLRNVSPYNLWPLCVLRSCIMVSTPINSIQFLLFFLCLASALFHMAAPAFLFGSFLGLLPLTAWCKWVNFCHHMQDGLNSATAKSTCQNGSDYEYWLCLFLLHGLDLVLKLPHLFLKKVK